MTINVQCDILTIRSMAWISRLQLALFCVVLVNLLLKMLELQCVCMLFGERELTDVRYMLSPICLSSLCLSVCNAHAPYSAG